MAEGSRKGGSVGIAHILPSGPAAAPQQLPALCTGGLAYSTGAWWLWPRCATARGRVLRPLLGGRRLRPRIRPRIADDGANRLFQLLVDGSPEAYRRFAEDYYEVPV